MNNTLDTELIRESRRDFLKIAGLSGLYLAIPVNVKASSAKYPKLNSGLTIDQYVEKYSDNREISEGTEHLLEEHKGQIVRYSHEYHVPANLLAAVIAKEHERGAIENVTNKILDFANRYTSVNSSAGIAQIRASMAVTLLRGLVKDKGALYLENMLHKDLGGFIKKLNSSKDKKELYEPVKKMLESSDELSIELAARFVGMLKHDAERAHGISEEHFLSDPVAVSLIFRGYTGGERMMNHIDPQKVDKDVFYRANRAMSYLRSDSAINRMFAGEQYRVNPGIGIHKAKVSSEYDKVAESFRTAFSEPGSKAVYRSEDLIRTYSLAMKAAKKDTERQPEYRKMAAYALDRAAVELMGSGAKNVMFRDPAVLSPLRCRFKPTKELMSIKDQILPCLLDNYRSLSREVGGKTVDVPYFGNSISLPKYHDMRKKINNWR